MFFKKAKSVPLSSDFSPILNDSRLWETIQDFDVSSVFSLKLLGVSTCTYQDSGFENCPHSQWKMWEEKIIPKNNRSGKSADLFFLYQTKEGRKTIIERLHKLGVNAYRFSIEWSHIEPKIGEFHENNLEVYIAFCKQLKDEGISLMVTLHHFSEPLWFHEMGSFEQEKNIEFFVSFVDRISPFLLQEYKGNPLVEYFCTINEPNVEALSRYIIGEFSPGLKRQFAKAGEFLKNTIKAHIRVYDLIKKINTKVQVGFVYQRVVMIPTNWIVAPFIRKLNHLMNDAILGCFENKKFHYRISSKCFVQEEMDPKADFVALQYYGRPLIGLKGSISQYEPMTEMPMREDPAGLYEAILRAHKAFNAPIIITENGISTHDENQRKRYLERALYAAHKASEVIGNQNIIGYFLWSFCDNFEWSRGMKPQAFGAYQLSDQGEIALEPKKGIHPFISLKVAKEHEEVRS